MAVYELCSHNDKSEGCKLQIAQLANTAAVGRMDDANICNSFVQLAVVARGKACRKLAIDKFAAKQVVHM